MREFIDYDKMTEKAKRERRIEDDKMAKGLVNTLQILLDDLHDKR